MPTKREVDAEIARLIAAHSAAMERYRQAWSTLELMPAVREMQETWRSLQDFAREHAEMYNTYAP